MDRKIRKKTTRNTSVPRNQIMDAVKKRPREKQKGPSGVSIRPAFLKKYGIEFGYVSHKFFCVNVLYRNKLGLTEARVLHDWLARYIKFREDFGE